MGATYQCTHTVRLHWAITPAHAETQTYPHACMCTRTHAHRHTHPGFVSPTFLLEHRHSPIHYFSCYLSLMASYFGKWNSSVWTALFLNIMCLLLLALVCEWRVWQLKIVSVNNLQHRNIQHVALYHKWSLEVPVTTEVTSTFWRNDSWFCHDNDSWCCSLVCPNHLLLSCYALGDSALKENYHLS